jgi:hypothetical protein
MAEWSKDHMAAIGSLNSNFGFVVKTWLNWRPGGATKESGDSWLGRSGSGYMASRHLQDCSPRLCRLRTVPLAPASKYWTYRSHADDMGPVSLVVGCQQKLDFSPLLHWVLWERSWVWTRGSDDRRVVDCVGSPSSRMQWICSNLLMTVWKVAICGPRKICMVVDYTWTECEKHVACWSGFPLQDVHQFESPWLSHMSNRLFVAVIM